MIIMSVLMGALGGILIAVGLWRFWSWKALPALCVGLLYGMLLGFWWEWTLPGARTLTRDPAEAYIPASERELSQPLMADIDFRTRDIIPSVPHEITIETPKMTVVFEEYGAVIKKMMHKRALDGATCSRELVFWDINPFSEREQGAFLLACDHDTPLAYHLVSTATAREGRDHVVTFSVGGDGYKLEKEFVVHADSYQIDVNIRISDVSSELRLRLLFPALYFADVPGNSIQILACSQLKPLKKYPLVDIVGRAWESPTLFGTEDRYFATSMVHDSQGFTTRAYVNSQSMRQATAILESRTITKPKNYSISFYCGPKERHAMDAVDARLTGALNYGWLTPVSTVLLALLTFMYGFVGNYGWAIIIVSLILKLLMLPFMARAEKSQKKMAELQRKLQAIERQHKDDKGRRDYERAELIKQHGFGGLFGMGFLPHILRLVVFFGLNRALSVAVELYRAPFVGWICDLSAADPYYVLPALAGLGTFIMMRKATDARQVVTVGMFSMIIIGVMVNLAAGVVLYLAVSTWLDIIQQYFQRKVRYV